jgi:flagellar biosynthesis activator protein FlaF
VYANQLEAYRTAKNSDISGRAVEAAALTRGAFLLTECQKTWDSCRSNGKLSEALRINQMIWSIFQAELVKENNPLPKQLKQDILSLSLFVDKRIMDIMANPDSGKLDAIININLNLAAGLSKTPNNGQAGAGQVLQMPEKNRAAANFTV